MTRLVRALPLLVPLLMPLQAKAADAVAGEKVFRKCAACHTVDVGGKNKIGPALSGVIGRTAGTADGYRYSRAMKAADFAWTAEALDSYLTSPKTFVPGNKMPFPGLKKADDRADVIAYIQSKMP
ncbi:MAG: cytochrome c family protein [Minwuia sp.]|nr:cytochrome c family protein [Minwuia sp.]